MDETEREADAVQAVAVEAAAAAAAAAVVHAVDGEETTVDDGETAVDEEETAADDEETAVDEVVDLAGLDGADEDGDRGTAEAAASPANADGRPTSANVFVGNVSLRTKPLGLLAALKPCGTVRRVYMPAGEGQPNAGFAFVDFAFPEDAQRAIALGAKGLRLDGHLLRIESGGPRTRRARTPAAPVAPAGGSSTTAAADGDRDRSGRRRYGNSRSRSTRESSFPDPLRTDGEPELQLPPSTVLGDRGQPLRVEPVRTAVRWDLLLEWEDVDLETVAAKPHKEAAVFGNVATQFAVAAPVIPAEPPKVTALGPVPAGYAPIASRGTALLQFGDAALHALLLANVARSGFSVPTPVQAHVLPMVAAGLDLVVCAETGSGKTAAFLLPIFTRLLTRGPRPMLHGKCASPTIMVLAPTRELAAQIYREALRGCAQLSYDTFIRCCIIHGGVTYIKEAYELEAGCHVLVATPGRLMDHLEHERVTLAAIQTLVIDEGDRMLDMGFEPQLRSIVSAHDMAPRAERQTLFFSATFPGAIRDVALTFLRPGHVTVRVGRVGTTVRTVQQKVIDADGQSKRALLVQLLDATDDGLAVVFAETKAEVRSLERFLVAQGFSAERDRALDQFRRAEKTTLVTTDVASRGLDIPSISHVINYDLPNTIDDYVHRVGRTGRAGRSGRATSLYTRRDAGIAVLLADALHEAGQEVPEWLEPSSMAHLVYSEDYHSWDKVVLARRKAEGADVAAGGARADRAWRAYQTYASVTVV